MPDPEHTPPPPEPDAPPSAADTLRDGVQRQRQHIIDDTGHDPLAGGADD